MQSIRIWRRLPAGLNTAEQCAGVSKQKQKNLVGEESMPQRDKYVQAKVMVHSLAGIADQPNLF